MKQRVLTTIAAAALAAATFMPAPAANRPFSENDLGRVVSLSTPRLTADGKRAVLIVTRINMTDDSYERDLDLIDIATHARRTLTYKRTGLSDPAWSPSGDRLAFIANAGTGDDAKSQVFVMSMDGGDARPVTSAPEGVDQFAWRPDGTAIAYAAEDAKPKHTGSARFHDAFDVGNNPITAREIAPPVHLWLAPLEGKARQLTRGSASVASGEASSTLSWSPDGKTLAFVLTPNTVLNDAIHGHIMLVDVATGALRRLTPNAGYESDPHFSPDGTHVSYTHSLGDSQITLNEAYVTTPAGGLGTPLSRSLDRPVYDVAWSPDSAALLLTANDATQRVLLRAPLGEAPARVDVGELNIDSQLDGAIARDGSMVFVAGATKAPDELYARPAGGGAPVKLTDYNAGIAALDLASSERITFASATGVRGDGVLLTPPGFAAGHKAPLVLLIHGGPTSASIQSFDRLGQLMAARGWLVLEPNYRGSDNLGLAYQHAVLYDAEDGPARDVIAAIDAVRAKGIVDEHRIAVGGWSYGGIMTAWLVTHYHFWRAAVSGASVNDWTFDYSVADDSDSDKAIFHGSPYLAGNRAEWNRASAITYAKDVTTPTLILSDVGDNRDPIATSYAFFHALKDNGKDVTFTAWPVAGHFPRDPVRTADVYEHWIDYIGNHLK
jgi:dipeptidyl aminopeptidase/acylaminoacyl peptidase